MNLKNQVKFGSGQPTGRGGRPKKQPFVEVLQDWLEGDGFIEFKAKDVELLPNGNYQIQMNNHQMIANKFIEMILKGDARFMEMYFKLFGEYQTEKQEVNLKFGADVDDDNEEEYI